MSQPFILAICSTLSWKRRSEASCIGGIVKLLFQGSIDLHEPATFFNDDGELFCHVAYTVTVRVVVSCGCAVWVMPCTV
jgi:hypothetical protein